MGVSVHVCVQNMWAVMYLQVSQFSHMCHSLCKVTTSLYSHCMIEDICLCVCVCVCVCVVEGTEGGVGGSVSQVHAGAEQGHQLLLIVGDVPLHDLLTGAQEALKRLYVYYCRERGRERGGNRVRYVRCHHLGQIILWANCSWL